MTKKRVLMITFDSLRVDYLRREMPKEKIYALYSAGTQTPVANFSLHTGRPVSHVFWPPERLPYEEEIYAEVVRTAFLSNNPCRHTSGTFPFNFFTTATYLQYISNSIRREFVLSQFKSVIISNMSERLLPRPSSVDFVYLPKRSRASYLLEYALHHFIKLADALFDVTKGFRGTEFIEEWVKGYYMNGPLGKLAKRLGGVHHLMHLEVVVDVIIDAVKRQSDKELVRVHVFTPHMPWFCGAPLEDALPIMLLGHCFAHLMPIRMDVTYTSADDIKEYLEYLKGEGEKCLAEKSEAVQRLRASYSKCVASVANFIKRLKEEFADEGWSIIISSDHTEYLGECGTLGHPPYVVPCPNEVPLLVLGEVDEIDLEELTSQAQIPSLVAKILGREFEAHLKEPITEGVVKFRNKGGEVNKLLTVTWRGEAFYAVDEKGREVFWGNEEGVERIREHLERSKKQRIRLLSVARALSRLRSRGKSER